MKFSLALIFLMGFSNVVFAFDMACVKTQVVRGDACNNLVVNFDFSFCGESAPRSRNVRSSCVNQKAVAFVKDPANLYIATYATPVKEGGDWRLLTVRSEARNQAAGGMQMQLKKNDGTVVAAGVTAEPVPVTEEPQKPLPAVAVVPVPAPSVEIAEAAPAPVVAAPAPEVKAEVPAPAKEKNLEAEKAMAKDDDDCGCDGKKETPKEPVKEPVVKHSGFIDFYYLSAMNAPQAVTTYPATSTTVNATPAPNVPYRMFDIYHDTFNVALAELTLKKDFENAGGQIDLGYGNATYTMDPNDVGGQNVLQAKAYYKLGPSVKLTVGKMFTHMGLEEAYSVENFNYSRSLIFTYLEPLWHTGAALEFQLVPGVLAATLYGYNGWNGSYMQNQKMTGLRLDWKASNELHAQYNMIYSAQPTVNAGTRQEHQVSLTWKPSKDETVAAEYVWGYQSAAFVGQDTMWNGFEVLAKKAWGKFSVSPRYELISDPQGYAISGLLAPVPMGTYTAQNIYSATLTLAEEIQEGARVIAEFRQDTSDQNVFKDMNYLPTNTQSTATLAFQYEF